MKSWEVGLRIAGLFLLFNIVPFARGCDIQDGLHVAAGFPAPYASHQAGGPGALVNPVPVGWSNFDAVVLFLNLAILGVGLAFIKWASPDASNVLISQRFLFLLGAIAIAQIWTSGLLLFVLIAITVGIAVVVGLKIGIIESSSDITLFNSDLTIDLLSRLLFFLIVSIVFFAVRKTGKKIEQSP